MKQILLWLLTLTIALPALAQGITRDFQYTYNGNTITYTVIDEDAKTCKTKDAESYGGIISQSNYATGDLEIPATVSDGSDNYSVTSIGDYSFYQNNLTSIKIPDSVIKIGNGAFRDCRGYTTLNIPNSVTNIGDYAFSGCSSLTSVTLPNSLTFIGSYAFGYCDDLKEVHCEAKTPPYTKGDVFTSPHTLTLYVPESSVATYKAASSWAKFEKILPIGYHEFTYTYKGQTITYLVIDEKLKTCKTKDSEYLDTGAVLLAHVISGKLQIPATASDGTNNYTVTSLGKGTFSSCKITSVSIPNSITSIGDDAFHYCQGLTSVEIPNSVTSIGQSAFYYCTGLTSVTIGNSITSIGADAFLGCSKLTEIYCSAAEPPVCGSSTFFDVPTTCKVYVPKNSVEAYRNAKGWSSFKNIVGVEIDEPTFTVDGVDYEKLTDKDGCVKVTGADAALTSLVIPATVQKNGNDYQVVEIAEKAFEKNSALTEITIPASVVDIKIGAFTGCTNLNKLTLLDGSDALHIDNIWVNNGNSDEAEGEHAFHNCPLKEVYIGRNLRYVSDVAYGWSPFAYTPVETATFGEGVTNFPLFLFYKCNKLSVINIPSTITEIEDNNFSEYGFRTCSALRTINVTENNPSFVTVDGVLYDKNQSKLLLMPASNVTTSLEIPASVTEIGRYALHNCKNLTSVTIPTSISKIGVGAFYGCTGLQTVVYEAARPIEINEENIESYYKNVFSPETYSKAVLWINSSAYQLAKSTNPWSQFANISYPALELSASELSIVEGDSEQIIATTSKGENLTNGLTWSSSNPSVVSVSETGMITAVGIGVSTITCTWTEPNGNVQTKDIVVEVKDCVVRIKLPNGYTELCGAATNSFKLRFGCEPGYVLHQVTLDDTDITDEVNASADGSYVVQPARKNRELFVVFREDKPTGIDGVQPTAQNIKLHVSDGHISIEGAALNSEVRLYDTTGRLLKRTNDHSFDTNAQGVIILTVDGQSFKFSM